MGRGPMKRKRWSDELQIVYEDEGTQPAVYGRVDQHDTEEEFREAAAKFADDYAEYILTGPVRRCWIRINPLSLEDQDGAGFRFVLAERYGPGRGRWETWTVEVGYSGDDD